jgi:mono/diheme cytochrome c family protein
MKKFCVVVAVALASIAAFAQGRGGVASFPAQQRDPADPAIVARGRAIYDTECRSCHGADLRGGEQGGSNLLRVPLVLNDREGELIQPVVQGSHKGRISAAGLPADDQSAGRLHPQRPCAGSRTRRSASWQAR